MTKGHWLKKAGRNPGSEHSQCYWLRTSMGLENLVLQEVESHCTPEQTFKSHRNVFIQVGQTMTNIFRALRTPDDAYEYLGYCEGIDHTRQSLDTIQQFFIHAIAPDLIQHYAQQKLRITVSFLGKRNYNRYLLEKRLGESLSGKIKLLDNEQRDAWQEGELRLRVHLEDDRAYWGLGLADIPLHRRFWRAIRYTGQVHTPVAACMARQVEPKDGQVIFDPFCGSGTLLIESAMLHTKYQHLGHDISQEAIEIARESAAQAETDILFEQRDSLLIDPPQVDYYLVSNPPWGDKHEIGETDTLFYKKLAQLIRKSAGAVLLLPENSMLRLQEEADWEMQEITQTRIRGKLAYLLKIKTM